MAGTEVTELKRVFTSRLDMLDHILDVGQAHLPDIDAAMGARLAPDMFPLGTQVAFACNQPRGFALWCARQPIALLDPEVRSLDTARGYIRDTRALVAAIDADDTRLDETKRTGLGPGRFCETPARLYASDYLLPNFYFHITATYAILRTLGVPVGKADFMHFLLPHVRQDG